MALSISLNRIADALNRIADNQVSPGGAPAPPLSPQGPPSGVSGAPPGGSDDTQVKKGKAIYAICKKNGWDDIAAIGERVTGRTMNPNSQKWDEADQNRVLDVMKNEWRVG